MKILKNFTKMIFCLILIQNLCLGYSGGNGNENNPFQIANPNDLQELMNDSLNWSKHYILTNDIDCTALTDPKPIGTHIDKTFKGTFDGFNFTISNINMFLPTNNDVGLFGICYGIIKNVNLINSNFKGKYGVGSLIGRNVGKISDCNIHGINIEGNHDIGGFCGYNSGHIINCKSNVVITGNSSVGGFCGRSLQGSFLNCSSEGEVICNHDGAGFCAQNRNTWIEFCFTKCNVTGQNGYIAGFCCELSAEGLQWPNTQEIWFFSVIQNCYAVGNLISNKGNISGFCYTISKNYDYAVAYIKDCYFSGNFGSVDNSYGFCFNSNKLKITNCYWDSDKTNVLISEGGTGKSTLDMYNQSTFVGWDFDSIWYMPPNDYPKLYPYKPVSVDDDVVVVEPENISIYPNPTTDLFNIEYNLPVSGFVYFELFDILGNRLLSFDAGFKSSGINRKILNINFLPTGSYNLILKIDNKFYSKKIIKTD